MAFPGELEGIYEIHRFLHAHHITVVPRIEFDVSTRDFSSARFNTLEKKRFASHYPHETFQFPTMFQTALHQILMHIKIEILQTGTNYFAFEPHWIVFDNNYAKAECSFYIHFRTEEMTELWSQLWMKTLEAVWNEEQRLEQEQQVNVIYRLYSAPFRQAQLGLEHFPLFDKTWHRLKRWP